MSVDSLAGVERELLRYARVATFQQRGLAPSTTEGPYDIPTAVEDVRAVLRELGEPGVVLAGHSWGAHLALGRRRPRSAARRSAVRGDVYGHRARGDGGRWPAGVPDRGGGSSTCRCPTAAGGTRGAPSGGGIGRGRVRGDVRASVAGLLRRPVDGAAHAPHSARPRRLRAATGRRPRSP